MYRQVFYLTVLLLLRCATCILHSAYEEFNNNKIVLTNTNWTCIDNNNNPSNVFSCSKGMDLVVLNYINQYCNAIQNIIDTTLPHFKIYTQPKGKFTHKTDQLQLYIDVYGYHTIDGSESFWVGILENSLQESLCLSPSSSQGKQLQQCSEYNNRLIRQSFFKEIDHNQQQVSLKIQNKFLILKFVIKYIQTKYLQQVSILVKLKIKIQYSVWSTTDQPFSDESYLFRNVQLILDRCYKTCKTCSGEGKEQCLTCYNGIIMSPNNSCASCKDQIGQSFLKIPEGCRDKCNDNQGYDEDYVCFEDMQLQVKCEQHCQLCTNTQSCLICNPQKYLYFGQCMDICPEYTKVYGSHCLSSIDTLKNNNLRITQLEKEFYDLSTTKSSTDALFSVLSSDNQKSFQKGSGVYYSYFSNRRIFGGPIVWVSAKFKFSKSWTQDYLFIRIIFEVILGDIELNKNTLTYKVNDQSQLETLTLNQTYQGNNPSIQDQIWPNQYVFNIYYVDKTINYQISTTKQLIMEIECQNPNQLGFCGIQNLVVVGFSNCEPEYQFDLYNYQTGRNPCIPICGDKIIVGKEECDDGNNNPFDGCFNCRYQCEEHCVNCVYGYCLEKETYDIQIIGLKLSQDLDVISLSCFFHCSICIQNLCLQCNYGYYLNTYTNLCETRCGDSIQQGNEQCDDGIVIQILITYNSDNYDGCSNCELIQYEKCDTVLDIKNYRCSVCHYGKCLKCNDGFLLDGDLCISICGDGLLNVIEEECDVQNGEGCINCKIQNGYVCGKQNYSTCKTCDIECTQCLSLDKVNLICKSCIDGYYPVEDKCYQCDQNCITCNLQPFLCIIILNSQL